MTRSAILMPDKYRALCLVTLLAHSCGMRVVSVPLNARLTAGELAWQDPAMPDCRLVICEAETSAQARQLEIEAFDAAGDCNSRRFIDLPSAQDDYGCDATSPTTSPSSIHRALAGKPKSGCPDAYGNIYHSALRIGALKLGNAAKMSAGFVSCRFIMWAA